MIQTSFPAMGTTFDVVADSLAQLEETRQYVDAIEGRFSRFKEDSELRQINSSPEQTVEVSQEMAAVLATAKTLQDRTQGLVDPAVGNAVIAWGYASTFSKVVDLVEAPGALPTNSWGINGRNLTRTAGCKLDLGGVAKGWTADRAVEEGMALVVSAGGDIRSAVMDTEVVLFDDVRHDPVNVALGSGGLATSSISKRTWMAGHVAANHLIDPQTTAPVNSPVVSATARCRTAAAAEAAAKALIFHGTQSLVWAEEQPWIEAAMIVWHDESVFSTHGWEFVA